MGTSVASPDTMIERILKAIYGVYALTAFVVVVLLLFCPILIVTPWLSVRRFIGRWAVRSWLFSVGVSFRVRDIERLPDGPCVVVCNHASYVDGIVLTAALPERFTFLVQHRAEQWPYVGLIILRMGVRFVNRESPRAAASAALGLMREARKGGSLAIFPEGSFQKEPGLMPFYSGAFLIAAKTGLPLVPVVMRGTRTFFHDGARWPSWSSVEIEFFEPEYAAGVQRKDAEALKTRAFQVIEVNVGEGDGLIKEIIDMQEAA